MQTFNLADPPQPLPPAIATTWASPTLGNAPSGWLGVQNTSDSSSQPDWNLWQLSIDAQIDMDDYAPPYASGTCSFHLNETQDCDIDYSKNLYGNVVMMDNNKNIIGKTVNDIKHPIGYHMDNDNPYSFTSVLPHPLVITGEHENDYVQFTYGNLSWQSKTPNGGGTCTVGGWDPRDGPNCASKAAHQDAVC